MKYLIKMAKQIGRNEFNYLIIFFDMSTQRKGKRGFELVTSALLGIVHSQLN
jgi:hypothetical protein